MELTFEERNMKRLEDSLMALDQSDLQPEQKQEMVTLIYNLFIGCNVSFEMFQMSMNWLQFYRDKWQRQNIDKLKGGF